MNNYVPFKLYVPISSEDRILSLQEYVNGKKKTYYYYSRLPEYTILKYLKLYIFMRNQIGGDVITLIWKFCKMIEENLFNIIEHPYGVNTPYGCCFCGNKTLNLIYMNFSWLHNMDDIFACPQCTSLGDITKCDRVSGYKLRRTYDNKRNDRKDRCACMRFMCLDDYCLDSRVVLLLSIIDGKYERRLMDLCHECQYVTEHKRYGSVTFNIHDPIVKQFGFDCGYILERRKQ